MWKDRMVNGLLQRQRWIHRQGQEQVLERHAQAKCTHRRHRGRRQAHVRQPEEMGIAQAIQSRGQVRYVQHGKAKAYRSNKQLPPKRDMGEPEGVGTDHETIPRSRV